MQINLAKGYQKKLITESKNRNNLNWKQLSSFLGYSTGYLKNELRNEKTLLSEKSYFQLCKLAGENFDEHIIKKLEENWGRKKGGRKAGQKKKMPKMLAENTSAELAELIGIILGDGNIWSKKGYYYVRITGHLVDDRDYLLNFVKPLIFKVFNCKMYVLEYPKNNQLVLSKASKDLVYTLLHFGLIAGNKKENNVKIPAWVFQSEDYLKACIRGLIDTDGSVVPITNRNYSYIWFRSAIPALRKSFSKAMKVLNIKTSIWSRRKENAMQIYIGGKKEILKYYERIGFSNPKHVERFYAPIV